MLSPHSHPISAVSHLDRLIIHLTNYLLGLYYGNYLMRLIMAERAVQLENK